MRRIAGQKGGGWRRRLRIVLVLLGVPVCALVMFLLFGGLEAIARWQMRRHLVGRLDVPGLRAGFTYAELTDGRLWDEAQPDHVLLLAPAAEAQIDPLRFRVPWIRIRGGVLSFRERIDSGFVRRTGSRFPRIELLDTTVRLAGEEVLHADQAVLTRDSRRRYAFHATGLTHRGLEIDEISLLLSRLREEVRVSNARVRLLGGTVEGNLQLSAAGDFAGRLDATGIDLETLARLLGRITRTRLGGRLAASVEFRGSPYDLESLRATGTVHARELDIQDEPLLLEILALLHRVRPEESPFESGRARFEIEGNVLRILEAEVLGAGWGLRGVGEIRLDTEELALEVVLVNRGTFLADLPLVGGRLRAASEVLRERVARARIRGTFQRVRVVSAALDDLGERMVEFVRKLLTRDE